jgi:release factor glutamine methyltransferase
VIDVWAAVSGQTVGEAWLRRDEPKSPETVAKFETAMSQIARGVPFAYAVGRVGFRTLDLAIDRRALIPRPETEGLVELVLREGGRGKREAWGIAADVGTGSGCIALSLAVEGCFDKVLAVERSPAATALARENLARISPRTPVEVREGDLLEPLRGDGNRYRVIVANPPYLTATEYAALDPSVRDFEPGDALMSGADGLEATEKLLAGAAALLEAGGLLALEIDERRATEVQTLGARYGWSTVEIHDDLFGRPRYALAVRA